MSPKEEFLSLFRELEEELVKLSRLKDNYVSFNRALNQVHYKRYDPFIATDDVFEFLKSAADLRNILSHRNDIAIPTENFLERFRKLVKNILYPTKLYDIATKGKDIIIGYISDKVMPLARMMDASFISHIPVYSHDGTFMGVFSRSSFFEYYLKNQSVTIDETTTIYDLKDVLELDKHRNESYLFEKRDSYVIDVYNRMTKTTKEERRLSAIFLTKNGKRNEPLLGIVTQTDILRMIVDTEILD